MAGLGANISYRDAGTFGRRGLQRLARDRAGNAQLFVGVRNRARAARHLQAGLSESFQHGGACFFGGGTLVRRHKRRELICESGVEVSGTGPCEPDFELAGIEVHLFGDHDRLHGADALTDVGVLCNERDFFRADLDPGIEGHGVGPEAGGQWIAVGGHSGLFGMAVGTESDAAGYGGGSDDEGPTGKTLYVSHITSPPSLRQPHGSQRECADRCRNGIDCRTSPH